MEKLVSRDLWGLVERLDQQEIEVLWDPLEPMVVPVTVETLDCLARRETKEERGSGVPEGSMVPMDRVDFPDSREGEERRETLEREVYWG